MDKLNLELYKKLYLVRRAEEEIIKCYFDDEMKTPMHMSMGEEAIAVGICHALKDDDQVFGTYRSHAIYLAKTGDVEDFFAEIYGKDTALLKGKGGSMHLCSPDNGFMGSSAIVASAIPVAVGAAFANKMAGNGRIVTVFFGDGAIDEGVFWESLNAACLWKLPVIFVCEDNELAVHTPKSLRHGYRSISSIVADFNCRVFKEESTDVETIYRLAEKAIGAVRGSGGPCFLDLRYYRYLEHVGVSEDFKSGYRSREEFEKWRKKDPVEQQRKKLIKKRIKEEELDKIEDGIAERLINSMKAAQSAPFPGAGEIEKEVL
ncbi:MAG: thiamine pyrophosphate-dependent dehydrogenase E1 component subunit alpha [Elusimicrobia bacterium]|nr:thiamine pyrophosphate-dependent dehydrogenase E1 component subunit alpha [Elusimicrobiota bacterium]